MKLLLLCLFSVAYHAAALSLQRREVLARAVAGGATLLSSVPFTSPASAVSARSGLSSPFTGEYNDPQ